MDMCTYFVRDQQHAALYSDVCCLKVNTMKGDHLGPLQRSRGEPYGASLSGRNGMQSGLCCYITNSIGIRGCVLKNTDVLKV